MKDAIEIVNIGMAEVFYIRPGIVCVKAIRDGEITTEVAYKIIRAIRRLTVGLPYALLYDMNKKTVLLSAGAKRLAARKDILNTLMIARALVAHNLVNKLEMSHFIKATPIEVPTQAFANLSLACDWIEKMQAFEEVNVVA